MKTKFAKDFKPNENVDTLFLVARKEIRPKRTGGDYLFTVLSDRTGAIQAFLWDNVDHYKQVFEAGDVVHVAGLSRDFNNTLQITIHKIRRIPPEQFQLSDFVRTSEKNAETAYQSLLEILGGEVRHPLIRQLLLSIFEDPDFSKRFKECPAAKALHHAYIGGLLDHTLSLLRLCLLSCQHYPVLNRSLLLAGAALHDIGKLEELSWTKNLEYTDVGRLVGHITLETLLLDRKMNEIEGFPEELRMEILHLVISHHRELEFGSPKRPKTLEALVLSYLDDLDAKLASFQEAMEQPGENEHWTPFNPNMQRFLYRHRIEDPPAGPTGPADTGA